jgi:uridylate kinase
MSRYKRILLKISGEALGGEAGFGIDGSRAREIVGEIVEVSQLGVEIGLVVGGGNFFRGVSSDGLGIERTTVDAMGMLATTINALAVADMIRTAGTISLVQSAVGMDPLAARYDRRSAVAALESGTVVVFAAGTGNPYFSTDTAASLRAVETKAEIMFKATKVDGVYDKDPMKHDDAKRYEKISYAEVLERGLAVMDLTAVALCRENQMPVLVFDLNERGSLRRAVEREAVGTLVS